MPADQPLTVGTAGHIDHGKTALVAALTGVDTDRLPQEKARGISIELGYAPLELPSGRRLSVVDVPGHERFVRTMVAGATGIDMFLLVVAADDGVMPQTREHLAILELLDVPAGVVAMTKRDLVDDELAELARLSVDELLEDGRHAGSDVVEVSSRTGAGVDDLRAALARLAGEARTRAAGADVRLPIDRAFSLRGIGTVVTGTLWSGTVRVGDRLAIEPGGREVRVRSVQVHDHAVDEAAAGQRVALALVGVERTQVKRGDTAASPGTLPRSFRLDCRLRVLPSAGRGLRNGDVVTVHHGTAEALARVALREGSEVPPGGVADVQLRLRRRVAAAAGDRLIVRLTSPQVTVAGATVTDPAPPRGRSRPVAALAEALLPSPKPAVPPAIVDELRGRLAATPLQPPALAAADAAAVAVLIEQGLAVRAGRDLAFTAEAFEQARAATIDLAGAAGSVTLAQLRDRLGISRKYAQALLEALDAHGITRRIGDERVLRRRGRE
ncbi:MAG: selenocysteine-specific translation elongation factor [Gaiellales bacterium]